MSSTETLFCEENELYDIVSPLGFIKETNLIGQLADQVQGFVISKPLSEEDMLSQFFHLSEDFKAYG
ncbi:MAG: hypothetical protein OQJ97_16445 [Rhodospirillales bacterium]|nr:hypothetical protein [Rhodospirillales bacterium]